MTTIRSNNTRNKKPWYRSVRFWLPVLFISYNLFAWLGVPIIVKNQLSSVLKENANWKVEIERIVFNPYALSLELSHAHFTDNYNSDVIRFKRFYINVNALRSLTGTISFDEVSLESPQVKVLIDEQGLSNFQRDFTPKNQNTKPEAEESSEILALFFAFISISEGELELTDMSLGETFKHDFKPLSLKLQNFSTRHNDGGDYAFAISLGSNQHIEWQGQIGVAPLQSKGHLALKNIQASSFWHYLKASSPYWLNQAKISLSGDYDLKMETLEEEPQTHFLVTDTQLSITDIKLAPSEAEDDFLQLKALHVSPIEFDLSKQSLALGTIRIDTPQISTIRHDDGALNLLKPLQTLDAKPESTPATTTQAEKPNTPFKWRIDRILVENGSVRWQDLTLNTPADLQVNKLELSLGQLSQDLSQNTAYQISLSTGEASHSFTGQVSPQPFAIKGNLTITDFPLNWAQNYVSERANIILNSGTASIQSQYQLTMSDALSGEITTSLQLDQLALSDSLMHKPLTGFKQLSISPIALSLGSTTTLDIETIRLVKPYADVFISEKGEVNLAQLSSSNEPEHKDEATTLNETKPNPSDDKPNHENPSHINIGQFEIESGRFEFSDTSQSPTFYTYFDQITGSVKNLSSDLEAQSQVNIHGSLETYGQLSVQGTSNPLSQKPNSDLNIQVKNINLSTASPYSSRFAGYLIDKGKLDLNLNYKINETKLKASNHIFINQFEFGASVDSPDATNLPLPLAIGIMKNTKGEIDIDLPISGDLNDPSFSFGGVVVTAFTNLITKIVTSPFSALGSLVEGDDDISSVKFAANQSKLDLEQTNSILKLAEALKDRPKLNLEIRGLADSGIDMKEGVALSEDALKRLAKNRTLAIAKIVIEQGGIKQERVFTLEPEVIHSPVQLENNMQFVPSKFTLSVK